MKEKFNVGSADMAKVRADLGITDLTAQAVQAILAHQKAQFQQQHGCTPRVKRGPQGWYTLYC